MKEFLMIFRNEKRDGGAAPSAEQMQLVMKEWQNWIGSIASQGKFLGTNRLYSEGSTLLPDGTVLDGPYAELKEVVGGYLLVKAESLQAAQEMAKGCPNLKYGGNVEIRAVMSIDQDVKSKAFLAEK
ncbi:YciI family protein [Chitinophaga filiformis]|uniref:YciI family protein n=1 Tax=Chitinophaga filiformis TaxID=104663 RepID=UPI001F18D431|nr:YciI family protein [Chitinophaga filiformis]MCF6401341.1 YciI family protein [Chitinophaga filiformis]